MVGRGIAVAGVWLGVGIAIGLTGTGHPSLPGWVFKWLIVAALVVSLPIVLPLLGPWSWDKQ